MNWCRLKVDCILIFINHHIASNHQSICSNSLHLSSDKLRDTYLVSFIWQRNSLISWTCTFSIEQAKECFSSFMIWAFRYRHQSFQHFKTTCDDTLCKSDLKIW